jgi:Arc/MetJ family transcription regulator
MGVRIEVDEALLAEAQEVSGHASKRKTVEEALRLMIRLRRQEEVRLAVGKVPLARISRGAARGAARRAGSL